FGADVVLVQADADVLRVDLDEFAERVLQAPADGDGAAERGVVAGELLAADGAGRVDAGAGLVDDDVGEVGQPGGDQVGDDLLGFAAGGAVADGDDGNLVLADQLFELGLGVLPW